MTDDLSFAPRDVGPNLRAEPTAEQRSALAAYLRGLADAIEHPNPLDLPVRVGLINTEVNDPDSTYVLVDADPWRTVRQPIGRQVKITIGWGSPAFGWDWR